MISDQIIAHYRAVDPATAKLLTALPPQTFQLEIPQTEAERRLRFYRIIIGQQLSTKAAAAIWQRSLPLLTQPKGLEQTAQLRASGISQPKLNYLQGLQTLKLSRLAQLSEAQIIEHLTAYKGVGIWTAEMALIFIFQRPDVFSWSDLGLRQAAADFYDLDYGRFEAQLRARINRLRPYRTTAALALWRYLSLK